MEIKIGGMVRIRRDLVPGNMYGDGQFTDDMRPFLGEMLMVSYLKGDGERFECEESGNFAWTKEMLEETGAKVFKDLEKANRAAKKANKYLWENDVIIQLGVVEVRGGYALAMM